MNHRELERWRNPDLRSRLVAWWEGYDVEALSRAARAAQRAGRASPLGLDRAALSRQALPPATASAAASAAESGDVSADGELDRLASLQLDRSGGPLWSPGRAEGAQMLWGDGQAGPGDAAWMVEAVRSFGLTPAKTVLDLSAGLGGSARAIAGSYDTWVTGLEMSPLLARLGMERSKALGLAKKAPIAAYDSDGFNQAGHFDLVLADRVLHRVRSKEVFLNRICDCAKENGGLLLFDYVIEGTPASWDNWNRWRNEEPEELYPWSRDRMATELVQRNMDLRITEDLTALHRRQIVERVRALAERLKNGVLSGPVLSGLARELSMWWARLRVLGRGLSFVRYLAIKPA